MSQLRYFIKFVSCEAYANDLMDGKLFMNAAGYFWNLEAGRGDVREAAISDGSAMYMNADKPIYCMYVVADADVVDGSIMIEGRLIDEFCNHDGWLVVIDAQDFLAAIRPLERDGTIEGKGPVMYRSLHACDREWFFQTRSPMNLFVKHPRFAYQREYRLLGRRGLERNLVEWTIDGDVVQMQDPRQPFASVVYQLPETIDSFAYKLSTGDLIATEDGYCFSIGRLKVRGAR